MQHVNRVAIVALLMLVFAGCGGTVQQPAEMKKGPAAKEAAAPPASTVPVVPAVSTSPVGEGTKPAAKTPADTVPAGETPATSPPAGSMTPEPPSRNAPPRRGFAPSGTGATAPAAPSGTVDVCRVPRVREPAVAGIFYPRDAKALSGRIDELLTAAKAEPTDSLKHLRAIVVPHAGYEFSGLVAASAYRQLVGRSYSTVIVLAPSHTASYDGAYVSAAESFQTPLGGIHISPKAAALARHRPFTDDNHCQVQRPDYWRKSPLTPPPPGQDAPDTWEHSLEVQLPLLQYTLKEFDLVPVQYGDVDAKEVADGLDKILDDKTLVVVSSDLSHYHNYDTATNLDKSCVAAVCGLNAEWLRQEEACGREPLLTIVELARRHGWRTKLLDYRNSGDTSGDKDHGVVGYAAIAFYEPEPGEAAKPVAQSAAPQYDAAERELMLDWARSAVVAAVAGKRLPSPDEATLPEALKARRGCFVTLTKDGQLRGCIGSIFPQEPLYRSVISRAEAAAVHDYRFKPVTAEELDQIKIEVSVLTLPEPLAFKSPEDLLAKLRPQVDGVVLRVGRAQATFLPQVWEQIKQQEDFLGQLSQKAGLLSTGWKDPDAVVLTYQVEAFAEPSKPAAAAKTP